MQHIDAPEVRAHLNKVLASSLFVHSARLRRFLEFTTEYVLSGRGEELKEYLVGVEVFERSAGYDPRIDPIVRVEARRLRAKLRRYYETIGQTDAVRIELAKGTYAPQFRTSAHHRPEDLRTIAILPFANLSPDPENEYFADGLTDELLSALARVPGLRVIARTSVFALKGRAQDVRTLGQQLGALVIAEGSVRKAGERVRVCAQLVEVKEGVQLWSGVFDRRSTDILGIQEEIARAITSALRLTLAHRNAHAAKPPAYLLHMKGRYYWNQRNGTALRKAVSCFEEAIREDPYFAPAHAGLADAYEMLGAYSLEPPREMMPRAKQLALRALELDSSMAEPHATLGCIYAGYEWDWSGAEREFSTAMTLDPQYGVAYQWYAENYLVCLGRFEEAEAAARQAVALDPLSLIVNTAFGWVLYLSNRFEEALEQLRATIDIDGNFSRAHLCSGRVYLTQGRYEEAVAAFERARVLSGNGTATLCGLAAAYGAMGRAADASALIEKLKSETRVLSPSLLAGAYVGLGDREAALTELERAYDHRCSSLSWLKVHPWLAPLRSEPRFTALIRALNLGPGLGISKQSA